METHEGYVLMCDTNPPFAISSNDLNHAKEIASSFMYLSYWYDYLRFPCSLSSVQMKEPMIFVSRHHKRAEMNFGCKTCNQTFSTINNTITIKTDH